MGKKMTDLEKYQKRISELESKGKVVTQATKLKRIIAQNLEPKAKMPKNPFIKFLNIFGVL